MMRRIRLFATLMESGSRRRWSMGTMRVAMLIVLAVGARTVAGAPTSMIAEFRAAACYASSSACPGTMTQPVRCPCCRVANTEDVALLQVLANGAHPHLAGLPHRLLTVQYHALRTASVCLHTEGTGPPTYLRLRTLQC